MEFSYVNGQRRVAERRLKGICNICGGETISKCGNIRIHHWAHLRRQNCDQWWENETQWHREWKQKFPEECREVAVTSNNGEKHRADVKTASGRVLEFQHSPIKLEERQSRESFYEEMVWVVDGLRLYNSLQNFNIQLYQARVLQNSPIKLNVPKGNCTVLKNWSDSVVSVYIDFGDTTPEDRRFNFPHPILWRLYPSGREAHAKMAPVLRDGFIKAALDGTNINGIHDPNLRVMPEFSMPHRQSKMTTDPKFNMTTFPKSKISWQPSKLIRRETESHTDFALRSWGIDQE